jgi:putative FmdB family regulatory protein
MPIYEYKCESCGNEYEQLRRMSEADLNLQCPDCRSERVRRMLSSFAAIGGGSSEPVAAGCGKPQCGMTSGRFT